MSDIDIVFTDRIALFLFAHQDDEFGVFQAILNEIGNGNKVVCVYLTDGGKGGTSVDKRNGESLAVLEKLGVQSENVRFIGCELSIPDGRFVERLADAAEWVRGYFNSATSLSAVYVPAWEGGHQDHDAIHAMAVTLAADHGAIDIVRQFPLYTGYRCAGQLYRVFCALPANGEILKMVIPWRNRFRFMGYCLSYRSQTITWLGLFPYVVFHYLSAGVQSLQPVTADRIAQRPHEGALYYERRKFYTWDEMSTSLTQWQLR